MMTKEELTEAAYDLTGVSSDDPDCMQLERLITVTQHVFDLRLNDE
jgi:hypothetical protein